MGLSKSGLLDSLKGGLNIGILLYLVVYEYQYYFFIRKSFRCCLKWSDCSFAAASYQHRCYDMESMLMRCCINVMCPLGLVLKDLFPLWKFLIIHNPKFDPIFSLANMTLFNWHYFVKQNTCLQPIQNFFSQSLSGEDWRWKFQL